MKKVNLKRQISIKQMHRYDQKKRKCKKGEKYKIINNWSKNRI